MDPGDREGSSLSPDSLDQRFGEPLSFLNINHDLIESQELSKKDRRTLIRHTHLIRSVKDFTDKCSQFSFVQDQNTESQARALKHHYEFSIGTILKELKTLVDAVEDDFMFEASSELTQSITDECSNAVSKIFAFLDQIERSRAVRNDPRSISSRDVMRSSLELEELKLHSALLPSVPMFQGDVSRFPEFVQAFNHAVHSRKIPTMQKLTALRSKLQGVPLMLIEHFGSGHDDYEIAFKTIQDYYTGKNRTASVLISNFLQIKTVEKVDLPGLEGIFTQSKNLTDALCNIKLPDLGDYFMYSVLFSKLPTVLRDRFIEKQPNFAQEIPSTKQLLTFIHDQLTILRARPSLPLQLGRPSQAMTPRSYTEKNKKLLTSKTHATSKPTSISSSGCYFCGETHLIYNCPSFKAADLLTRSTFVDNNNICRTCLSAKHLTSVCPSQRTCTYCKARHHSWLHNSADTRPNLPKTPQSDSKSFVAQAQSSPNSSSLRYGSDQITNAPPVFQSTNFGEVLNQTSNPGAFPSESSLSPPSLNLVSNYPSTWYSSTNTTTSSLPSINPFSRDLTINAQ